MLQSASRGGAWSGEGCLVGGVCSQGGGWCVWSGGVCFLGGGAWSREGVPGPGRGCLVRGGGSAPGGWVGVWSGGVPGPGRGDLLPFCLVGGGIPACTEADTPPPPVDRHTLVKTLPWPNFVAAGNNTGAVKSLTTESVVREILTGL